MKITLGREKCNIKRLAGATGGRPEGNRDAEFSAVCTDSREADENTLFCAIRGERTDGHKYINNVIAAGCPAVLCEYIPEDLSGATAFDVVDDTINALNDLARNYRNRCKTVGVTGSVGKTTTKEFIAAALSAAGKVYKTKGNFNSTIGLPLSLLEIPEGTDYAVMEMGMSGRGEIEMMSLAATPDIAVITNVGSAHLEMLGSRENIRDAKLEIIRGLKKDGILIISADDDMLGNYTIDADLRKIGVVSESCDFRAVNIRENDDGTLFDVVTASGIVNDVFIPVFGGHNVYDALFGYAVAVLSGLDPETAKKGLSSFVRQKLRQDVFEMSGVTIIEDCYNASPESMRAALDLQKRLSDRNGGERTVALLGNMNELGSDTVELHRKVGEYCDACGLDLLVTFGELADNIAAGAGMAESIAIHDTRDHAAAAHVLRSLLRAGDILLVKASRTLELEKTVEILKEIMTGGSEK